MTVTVGTDKVAQDMLKKQIPFTARELSDMYGIPVTRAHSIISSLSSCPRYEIERIASRPLQIKIKSVDGVRATGPSWFEIVLHSKWPVRQVAA